MQARLWTATALLGLAGLDATAQIPAVAAAPVTKNTVDYIMGDAHKKEIHDSLQDVEPAPDALAQPDTSTDRHGVIDLDKMPDGTLDIRQIAKEQEQFPDNAGVSFSYNDRKYKIKAADLLGVYEAYSATIEKFRPGLNLGMDLKASDEMNAGNPGHWDAGQKMFVTTPVFVYMNSKEANALARHEAGHIVTPDEFRADSIAGPDMIGTIRRLAAETPTSDPMTIVKNRMAEFGNTGNLDVQHADGSISNTMVHPGDGRRIQYLETIEAFKKNKEAFDLNSAQPVPVPPVQRLNRSLGY